LENKLDGSEISAEEQRLLWDFLEKAGLSGSLLEEE
jgi:hypothetical protein